MSIETRIKDEKKQYRYRVYYTDASGNRKQKNSKWYSKLKECSIDEKIFNATLMKGENIGNIKFGKIAYDWLDYCKSKNKSKSIKEKQKLIEIFYFEFMDKNIYTIKPLAIKRWLMSDLIKYKRSQADEEYSTEYKNKIFGYLSSIFEYAIKFYDLPKNPCKTLDKFKKRFSEHREMTIYNITELNIFLSLIPDKSWLYCTFFRFLYFTGLRFGEAKNLQWIDYDGNSVKIRNQYDDATKKFDSLKTPYSKREIDLDLQTRTELDTMKEYYQRKVYFNEAWFIFGGTSPLKHKTVENLKSRVIYKYNLKHIRIHDFRHSHASFLISRGANIVAVSKRLGHASTSMTLDRYTHLFDSSQEQITNILDSVYSNTSMSQKCLDFQIERNIHT